MNRFYFWLLLAASQCAVADSLPEQIGEAQLNLAIW